MSTINSPAINFGMFAKCKLRQRQLRKSAKKNVVPADQVKPKTGPEKMLRGMPEKTLHQMFSYGDPTVYASAIVDGNLLIRTGQHLYCVRSE